MTPDQQAALKQVASEFASARGSRFLGAAGHGAFKATFRVQDADGSERAVKVYLPGAVSERAQREVDAMAHLSTAGHPSLPQFLDLLTFNSGGHDYLVSVEEFLAGGTLATRLASGPLSRDELVHLALQLVSALGIVGAAGLVHRDIKPDNVMFRGDGTAVLVDFGLVRNLGMSSLTRTWLAAGPGTPYFAAPEQLNNDKALIDHRTDQFALGATLAIAGCGAHPYAQHGETPHDTVARVAQRGAVSADFDTWTRTANLEPIRRMVEVWPHARYRTAAALKGAWQAVT